MANLSVRALSSTAVHISWTRPEMSNGNISFYRVYSNTRLLPESINETIPTFKQIPGSKLSINVTRLEKFTEYTISVSAINLLRGKHLEGPKTGSTQIKTHEDGKDFGLVSINFPVNAAPYSCSAVVPTECQG